LISTPIILHAWDEASVALTVWLPVPTVPLESAFAPLSAVPPSAVVLCV
jgi:hypothetical protein